MWFALTVFVDALQLFLAVAIPPAVFPGFLELLLAHLLNTRLGLDAPVILKDKL